MATSKPLVSVYLSPEIKAALDAWKDARGVKSSSRAVGQVLAEYFGKVPNTVPSKAPYTRGSSADGAIARDIARLNERIEQLSQALAAYQSSTDDAIARLTLQSQASSQALKPRTQSQQGVQSALPRGDSRGDSEHEITRDESQAAILKRKPIAILEGVICPECGSADLGSQGPRRRPGTGEIYAQRAECKSCGKGFTVALPNP